MTDSPSLDLTSEQKELVLRGLRFVRSSISMELLATTDAADIKRADRLREVDQLVGELTGGKVSGGNPSSGNPSNKAQPVPANV